MNVNRQQGFVLATTLWLTMILLVLSGLFSSYAYMRFDAAILAKQRVQEEIDRFTTEEVLFYLLATGITDRRGLSLNRGAQEYVSLGGEATRGQGDVLFDVVDFGGLVGLNSLNNYHLENLLSFYESDPLVRNALLQSLYDYIDLNESPRLNGGEASAYRVAGMLPPTNDYLKSPYELRNVRGWNSWLSENPKFDLEWLSPNWRSRLNLNTAPDSVLRRVLPLSQNDRELLIMSRQKGVFRDFAQIQQLLNLRGRLDEDFYTFLPMNRVRIRIYSENNFKVSTINASITPLSLSAPWVVDSRIQSERNFDIREPTGSVAREFFGR